MALLKIKDSGGNWNAQGNVGVLSSSGIVTILDKTFSEDTDWSTNWGNAQNLINGRLFWTQDVNGNALKLIRLWIAINWGDGSSSAATSAPGKYLCYIGHTPGSWYDGDDHSIPISRGSLANDIPSSSGSVFYGRADVVAKWSEAVAANNQTYTTSGSSIMPMSNFVSIMNTQYCDCFKFYCTGTAKAGTRIRVWGENVNF